jgi:trigger factor
MRATAAPEEGNKVRLTVEIDEAEVDKALEEVVRRLSRQVRVPGFRPGKVPRRIIEARMGGAAALRGEAIREVVPDFYAQAVSDTALDPIDNPAIDITSGSEGGSVAFDAVVLVRPTVGIPGYQGLVVTIPSLAVTDEEVTEQLDRLRATSGELVEVARPARDRDQVTIDLHGTRPGAGGDDASKDLDATDFLYEVGSEGVAPELDEHLRGARPGDIFRFGSTLGPEGEPVSFQVLVKEVKELVLPELTDEWAAEASEFATLDELKDDLRTRLRERHVARARFALDQRSVDALVELVTEEIPQQLVDEEFRERIHDLGHRLEGQGIGVADFVRATGQSETEFLGGLREAAVRSVKADLALRALADAESLEVTDVEVDEELTAMAERLEMDVDQVRDRLERSGRLSTVRSDRRKAKALRWLVDHVELVGEDGEPVSREVLEVHEDEEDSR